MTCRPSVGAGKWSGGRVLGSRGSCVRLVDVVGAVDTCEDEEEVEDIGRHTKRVKNQRTRIKEQQSKNNNQKMYVFTKQSQSKRRRL